MPNPKAPRPLDTLTPLDQPQRLTLLGSTGSIGTQVLDVVQKYPQHFQVESLACGHNIERLAEQIIRFQPKVVAVADDSGREALKKICPHFRGEILVGAEGLKTLASDPKVDTVVVGLVGFVGLSPTLEGLAHGKKVLTANKETIVCGGHLLAPFLSPRGQRVLPIDSEHSGVLQCLHQTPASSVHRLYLTASGGPFRTWSKEDLERATVEEALKHPNWQMGAKITIDSATLMNKGLEVIEAHHLFQLPYEQIEVLIHPQSVVHGGVEFVDGSQVFQLGAPDMHVPILFALSYPHRMVGEGVCKRLNWSEISQLTFEPPDGHKFPCLSLAYEAGKLGPTYTTVLNAANEVAVEAFLKGGISFGEIPKTIEWSMEGLSGGTLWQGDIHCLEGIVALDSWTRRRVSERLGLEVFGNRPLARV